MSIQTNNIEFINMTDYNHSKNEREAEITYNGRLNGFSNVACSKFRLQTQSFPLFVPNIIKLEDIQPLHINGARNMNETIMETPFSQKYSYNTDWNICCYDARHGTLEYDGRYVNRNVKWLPQKHQDKEPFTYPKTKREVLSNKFFHAYNSLHVLELVQMTLREIGENLGHPRLFYIIKVENGFRILKQVSKDPNDNITDFCKLFLNKAMMKNFYFHYNDSFLYQRNGTTNGNYSEVVFDGNNRESYTFDGETSDYIISQTLGFTTRMFPFSDIQFVSTTMNITPITECITTNPNDIPNKVPIILSYSLNVTDIDGIVDNMNYNNAVSALNPSLITGSSITDFKIRAIFKTFDNYSYPITLEQGDSLNLMLEMS